MLVTIWWKIRFCYVIWDKVFKSGLCKFWFKNFERNTRTRCEICSRFTIKIPERRHCCSVFIVNFDQINTGCTQSALKSLIQFLITTGGKPWFKIFSRSHVQISLRRCLANIYLCSVIGALEKGVKYVQS